MNTQTTSHPSSTNCPSEPKPNGIRRHCKIARLPAKDRERLNLMLRDGASYNAIISAFRREGLELNETNLSRWNAGGFQDWLREQSWLEEMRARLDFASSVVQQPNAELIDQASLRIAVVRMYTLLTEFDPATLKSKLAENPATYVRILNALCNLTGTALELRRDREEQSIHTPSVFGA